MQHKRLEPAFERVGYAIIREQKRIACDGDNLAMQPIDQPAVSVAAEKPENHDFVMFALGGVWARGRRAVLRVALSQQPELDCS